MFRFTVEKPTKLWTLHTAMGLYFKMKLLNLSFGHSNVMNTLSIDTSNWNV